MEAAFDRARATIEAQEIAQSDFSSVAGDIQRLEAYLNSEERRLDIQADESGELPADLRRGVLSEDGIWNLLESFTEINEESEI